MVHTRAPLLTFLAVATVILAACDDVQVIEVTNDTRTSVVVSEPASTGPETQLAPGKSDTLDTFVPTEEEKQQGHTITLLVTTTDGVEVGCLIAVFPPGKPNHTVAVHVSAASACEDFEISPKATEP